MEEWKWIKSSFSNGNGGNGKGVEAGIIRTVCDALGFEVVE